MMWLKGAADGSPSDRAYVAPSEKPARAMRPRSILYFLPTKFSALMMYWTSGPNDPLHGTKSMRGGPAQSRCFE